MYIYIYTYIYLYIYIYIYTYIYIYLCIYTRETSEIFGTTQGAPGALPPLPHHACRTFRRAAARKEQQDRVLGDMRMQLLGERGIAWAPRLKHWEIYRNLLFIDG